MYRLLLAASVAAVLLRTGLTQSANATYTIVAPAAFRPSSLYTVSATCNNVYADVTLILSIKAQDNSTLTQKQIILKDGVPVNIDLAIPDIVPETTYYLTANGSGGLVFSDNRTVTVKRKTLSLFVQTDKAMYKPGQKVLFRAIVVYPDLKPFQGFMDIEIYDLAGNKIMQWLQQQNDTGVVTQSLQLSDQPPLGDWKIVVTVGENTLTKTFQVAEYVLPKFEVSVTLPSYYLVNKNRRDLQKDLLFTVTAMYTYGQPVKGRANVTVQLQPYGQWDVTNYTSIMLDVALVDGKADVSLPIKRLTRLVPMSQYENSGYTPDPWDLLSYRNILVVANVNETVTGIVLSGNSTVQCSADKYKLTFLSISPDNYKPGLLYTAYLQLSQADNSKPDLSDIQQSNGKYQTILLRITKYFPTIYDRYGTPVSSPPPTNEIANITIDPTGYMSYSLDTADNVSSINLQADFYVEVTNNTISAYKYISVFKTRDIQAIQVSFNSQDGVLRPLQQVTFSVKTTFAITTFQYALISKGSIQLSGNKVGNLSREHALSLFISKDLAKTLSPSVRVVVWFLTAQGELVADSSEFTVAGGFANEVSLSFDRNMTTPSENVSLTIHASNGSSVFMLGVDQSVLILKGGNDITQSMVSEDLKNYDSVVNDWIFPMFKRKKRMLWWPIFIGGSDSGGIFKNAGLVAMTNNYLYTSIARYPLYAFGAPGAAGPEGGRQPQAPMPPERSDDAPDSSDDSAPRINFPETWLWTDSVTGRDGSTVVQATVPDTITSWIASCFAVSPTAGLGIAENTAKITVFKQFFLSPNLPYSIIRGEEFALQVTVFNYMSTATPVLVTLKPSSYFTVKGNSSALAQVESNDATTVYFWIMAQTLGQIPIYITGKSPVAGDSLIVNLLVKPEGVTQQYSTSVLAQLNSPYSTFSTSLNVSLPPAGQLVPGSEYLEVTAIGDIMGPSVKGLDNLLQMPYGCGEQNMLNFAPDVYIVDYLTVAKQLTAAIKSKALGFMNTGYQRQLTYQRSDGSFSAFGDNDPAGSVWLSAFTIKCFHQAKSYIPVEDSKIARTMDWILSNQLPNGSFAEPPLGRVIHTDMQGGSSKGIALTAYVLLSLSENKNNSDMDSTRLGNNLSLALSYLERQIPNVASDPYALSILSYALARSNSTKLRDVLALLENMAKVEGGTKHWEKAADNSEDEKMFWHPPYSQARSVNVEMTAYVLLTYCYLKDFSNSVPIVKWLVAQRNANGGFTSTQDTVMALEALARFAALAIGPDGERNLTVSIQTESIQYKYQRITDVTSILYQSYQIPSNTTKVQVSAAGKGSALVQLNVKYNVYETDENSGIDLQVNTTDNGDEIVIRLCTRWTKPEHSGMVIIEICQLTGYKPSNVNDLNKQGNKLVKRVEADDEKVVLYLDELTQNDTCINLTTNKVYLVNNVKDAPIIVYRYYDPTSPQIQLYSGPSSVDACTQCPQCCVSGTPDNGGGVSTTPGNPPTGSGTSTKKPVQPNGSGNEVTGGGKPTQKPLYYQSNSARKYDVPTVLVLALLLAQVILAVA